MLQEQTVVNKPIKDLTSLLVLDCTKFYSDGRTLKHTAAFRQIIKKGKFASSQYVTSSSECEIYLKIFPDLCIQIEISNVDYTQYYKISPSL